MAVEMLNNLLNNKNQTSIKTYLYLIVWQPYVSLNIEYLNKAITTSQNRDVP